MCQQQQGAPCPFEDPLRAPPTQAEKELLPVTFQFQGTGQVRAGKSSRLPEQHWGRTSPGAPETCLFGSGRKLALVSGIHLSLLSGGNGHVWPQMLRTALPYGPHSSSPFLEKAAKTITSPET